MLRTLNKRYSRLHREQTLIFILEKGDLDAELLCFNNQPVSIPYTAIGFTEKVWDGEKREEMEKIPRLYYPSSVLKQGRWGTRCLWMTVQTNQPLVFSNKCAHKSSGPREISRATGDSLESVQWDWSACLPLHLKSRLLAERPERGTQSESRFVRGPAAGFSLRSVAGS